MLKLLCAAAALALLPAAAVQAQAAAPVAASSQAAADFARIVADYEVFSRAEDPISSGAEGDASALSKLPGVTPADDARRLAALQAFKARVERIAADGLNEHDRLNYDFLRYELNDQIEDAPFDEARLGFNSEGGPEGLLSYMADSTPIRSKADAEAYLTRLQLAPRFIDDTTANARRGIKTGFMQARVTVEDVLPLLKAAAAAPVDGDPLLRPFDSAPATIPAADIAAYRARAKALIADGIRPAEQRFARMVETEYLPKSPATMGASAMPNGRAYYAHLVRHFTTTQMTPDQIHQVGLDEVARIRGEMQKVIAETGFKGSFSDFLHFLRTDPQFYVTSREALMEKVSRIAKRIDNELPGEFATLPRLTYGVREVPREIEENYTSARYFEGSVTQGIAGGLMVNTSHLDQRPLYEWPALALHEGVPGHHFQIALQQELGEEPWYRRHAQETAFVEGWALYSEWLGYDMKIYRDPYERFGQLSMEMWRACRLVADTGIHWKGWTIEQARACFRDNSALAPHNIETELQRYISWPGQALAYKIGQLNIRGLRDKAQGELGAKFDVRHFHDAVLLGGPMPLDLLDVRVNAWIEAQKTK
jgi:uncharacterized protein (DUF885 family)